MKTQQKKQSESSRHTILQSGIVDEMEYARKVYDYGIEYLSERFDNDERWLHEYERCEKYWRWWRHEWENFQSQLVAHCRHNNIEITYEYWTDEMRVLAHDSSADKGFQNYLKLLRNVRITKEVKSRKSTVRAED